MKRSLGPKLVLLPLPVWILGTYCEDGAPNIMPVSWCGVCSSEPAAVAVSLRPATLSHGNVLKRKAFTVGVPSAEHVNVVDFAGLVSGREVKKLDVAGLTSVRSEVVDAPFIQEFPLAVGCRLIKTVPIGSHTQFVGEIVEVRVRPGMCADDGTPLPEKISPIILSAGSLTYHALGAHIGGTYVAGQDLAGTRPPDRK